MNEETMKIANVPKWCNHTTVPDPETLVVMCQEMEAAGMHKLDPPIEDSRTGQRIVIEAALLFDEKHASEDVDYWMDKDFLEEVETFSQMVVNALKDAGPKFYNDEHFTMFGRTTLKDMLDTLSNVVTPLDPDKMLERAHALREMTKHLPVHPDLTRDELAHASCDNEHVEKVRDLINADMLPQAVKMVKGYQPGGCIAIGSMRVLPGGQEIWTGREWVPITTHGPDEPADRIAQAVCLWKEDEGGHWFTACNSAFTFNEGGPKDNRFGYCPYCGRHVIFQRFAKWEIQEDGEDSHTP